MKPFFYLFLFFAALFLPDYYIWASWIHPIVEHLSAAGVMVIGGIWLLPSVMILVALLSFMAMVRNNAMTRTFFGLILLCVIPKLIFTASAWLIGWIAAVAILLIYEGFILYGFFFGWRRIVVRSTVCSSPLLPESFEGYRILQLSDLHIGTFRNHPEFIQKLVRVVNEQHPDMIAFTGDLVNERADEVRPFIETLSQMQAPDGIYSVMGNHDYCQFAPNTHTKRDGTSEAEHHQHVLQYMEEKIGWHLLMNEHVFIDRLRQTTDGQNISEGITIIGVENISQPPFQNYGDLHQAMEGLTAGSFKVLLSHDPSHWRRGVLHQTDIALTLSGHTHAGQIRIGRFSPSKWVYQEWGGKYIEDGSMLHVSLGLGGRFAFRFGAWPEVNIIQLTKGTQKNAD